MRNAILTKGPGLQTTDNSEVSASEATGLLLILTIVVMILGLLLSPGSATYSRLTSSESWREASARKHQRLARALGFAVPEDEIEREAEQLLVPSIAPLADQVPLGKVDADAINRNRLRTNAEKMVVTDYFAKKYNVDPLTMAKYVQYAVDAGNETKIEPLLLLAIMSVESNFDPDVESPAGAQGLMQVITRIHAKKFAPYGGISAAFRPEVNIRVGALIIKQAIVLMGSLQGGLFFYVGAAKPNVSDGGFAAKVLGEYNHLLGLIGGGRGITIAPKPMGFGKLMEEDPVDFTEEDSAE